MSRTREIWVLGATGRIGQAVAERLARGGTDDVVIVGRDRASLDKIADGLSPHPTTRELAGIEAIVEAIGLERPAVVVNVVGSYAETAPVVARACMPGGAYVDLANDLTALEALLSMDEEAANANTTLISGAGFGVLGTEAVVARLCEGRPVPSAVRVDALASYASQDGRLGEAFAQTSVEVMSTGGLHYRDGELSPVPLGSNPQWHALPDGTTVASAAVPSGELLAARRASDAPNVDFTSALAPTSPFVRPILPLIGRLVKVPAIRRFMVRQMAASKTKDAPLPRPHTWGHAVVTWADGSTGEGWLCADDAMDYTADILTTITRKLTGSGRPVGAFTPAAAFGYQIAADAGGTFIDD